MSDDHNIDPEVQDVIEDQKRLARGVGRETATQNRKLKRLASKALEAIAAKDARAFAKHLREAGVADVRTSGTALGSFSGRGRPDLDFFDVPDFLFLLHLGKLLQRIQKNRRDFGSSLLLPREFLFRSHG
jgi:hypothetical protein